MSMLGNIIARWLGRGIDYDVTADWLRQQAFITRLVSEGWKSWVHEPPIREPRVQCTRDLEDVWEMGGLGTDPQLNVAGLYWRPAPRTIDVTPHEPLVTQAERNMLLGAFYDQTH